MSSRTRVACQVARLFAVLIAAIVSGHAFAACRKAPLGSNKASYFPAMAKRMAAAYGIGMKKFVQKGNYAGSGARIAWYRFGTAKEIEDDSGSINISDLDASGATKNLHPDKPTDVVGGLLLLGDNSETNLARLRTLATATVGYFTHVDESEIAPEIDAMLKKVVAAEPTKADVLKPGWKPSMAPVAQRDWRSVHVEMPTSPQDMDLVAVKVSGLSCK